MDNKQRFEEGEILNFEYSTELSVVLVATKPIALNSEGDWV